MCVPGEGVLCVYQVKVYYVYQVEEYYVCTRGRRVYIPVLVKGSTECVNGGESWENVHVHKRRICERACARVALLNAAQSHVLLPPSIHLHLAIPSPCLYSTKSGRSLSVSPANHSAL